MPIPERVPRPEKVQAVGELRELLQSATVILTDYQGLDMKQTSALRKKLRDSEGGYRIVKNTLLRLAAADTVAKGLADDTKGPTAIVFTDGDPVAAAKTLQEYAKGPKSLRVKGGVVDGQVFDADQMIALAKVPSKPELYAMVVGGLQSPITGLVGTLQSMISGLVMTLQGVADKKAAA